MAEIESTLEPLREQERPLFARLLQLYYYDFSEIDPDVIDETGQYVTAGMERYGRDPGFDAWLLRVAGKLAGFALIDECSPLPDGGDRHYIHEFHVLRVYRQRGLGMAMGWEMFDRYPGGWQIEQIGPNLAAQQFWRHVINRYNGGRYTERTIQGRRFPLIIQEFNTEDRVI
jgi:predicted acetyltransferase